MSDEKYGNVNITTIQRTKNDLRDALNSGDLEAAQKAWDRLEQWIDSPPMMPRKENSDVVVQMQRNLGRKMWLYGRWLIWEIKRRWLKGCVEEASRMTRSHFNIARNEYDDHIKREPK